MKTNFMKALAFVGMIAAFAACKKNSGDEPTPAGDFTITPASVTITVGETADITADVEGTVTFKSSNDAIASITSSGNKATIKGNKAGMATITATTADGKKATVKVQVNAKPVDPIDMDVFKGSNYIVVYAGETADAQIASKIALDLRTDDVDNFLYFWEGNFVAGAAEGNNAFGTVGDMLSVETTSDWGGLGFLIGDNNVDKLNQIQTLIGDDYEDWAFTMYLRADKAISINVNLFAQDGETGAQSIFVEVPGDSKWHEYTYNLGDLANLEFGDFTKGANIITFTSWNVSGGGDGGWTAGSTLDCSILTYYKLPE